ncbi:hypothetical protein LTR15_011932 [Elasticomyces elasticus]|nr:hypothetical protein LTR15_011932 [Elasticomyces elasticus]
MGERIRHQAVNRSVINQAPIQTYEQYAYNMAFDFQTKQIRELRETCDSSAQAASLTHEPKYLLTMERDLPRGLVEKKVLGLQAGLASRDLEVVALSKKLAKLKVDLKRNQEWDQSLSDFCLKFVCLEVGDKGVVSAKTMNAIDEQVRRDWHLRGQAGAKVDILEMEANRLRMEVDKLVKENNALKAERAIVHKYPKLEDIERTDEPPRKRARV